MTLTELAYKLRPYIEKAAQSLNDVDSLEGRQLFPRWEKLAEQNYTAENAGFKFQHNGLLYKTAQPNMSFQAQWIPGEGTESMYTRIDETHAGTLDDPIPYGGNMELVEGLYYIQDGVTYLCIRSTGIPVHNALSELVGVYVEVAG